MSTSKELTGIDFSESLREVGKGEIVKPQLRTFLFEAKFANDFTVHFKKGDSNRDPDGWFWPSTHPLWSERALHLYLTNPAALPYEEKRYMNVLSLTMGSAVHGFVETCMEEIGLRPKELNTCTMCAQGPDGKVRCTEAGVRDENTGSRGHMDGILDLTGLIKKPNKILEPISGFEFKTSSKAQALRRLQDEGLDYYRDTWPEYYAQNQEYMRLSRLPSMVVLFMQMGFPWTMVELHVAADSVYQMRQRDKYLRVRESATTGFAPECCDRSGCALKDYCNAERGLTKGRQRLIGKGGQIGFHR